MGITLGKKKEKKEREPQYRQSLTNMQVRNYRVYEMSPIERILVFLAAFAAGPSAATCSTEGWQRILMGTRPFLPIC